MSRNQRPKEKIRRAEPRNGVFAKIAIWLTDSPAKTVLVAVVSTLVFLGGVGSTGWTLYKNYKESELEVTLMVRSVETFATMRLITAAQMAGMEAATADSPLMKMGAQVPTIAATFELENPTANNVNIRECTLIVKDKEAKPIFSSKSYSAKSIKEMIPESPTIWKLEPKSIIIIDRFYSFSQASDVENKLVNPDLALGRVFEASCLAGDKIIKSKPFIIEL